MKIKQILIFLYLAIVVWVAGAVLYFLSSGVSNWIQAEMASEFGMKTWLLLNPVFIILLLISLAVMADNRQIMYFCIPFLLFYGTAGLIRIDNWTLDSLPLQVMNLLMTGTVVYILFGALKRIQLIKLVIWLVIGCIGLIGLNIGSDSYREKFLEEHPEVVKSMVIENKAVAEDTE